MAIKSFRPYTPSRRNMTVLDHSKEITKQEPEKSLLAPMKSKAGRNAQGKITVRHQGGGNKKKYRIIDFKRNKDNVACKVVGIEYDPNRTANIALVQYEDGEKRYILAPKGLMVGDKLMSGEDVEIRIGNSMPMSKMPIGSTIHNIELNPGQGGKLVRSAGNEAQLVGRDEKYATVKMPSGEMRLIPVICRATIGRIGNEDSSLVKLGKAGKTRYLGIRPAVRGSVMNPNDHPHGGGEGKAPVGRKAPLTPWGKPALGLKTRNKKRYSNNLIIRRKNDKH